jgi:hypothetical protein
MTTLKITPGAYNVSFEIACDVNSATNTYSGKRTNQLPLRFSITSSDSSRPHSFHTAIAAAHATASGFVSAITSTIDSTRTSRSAQPRRCAAAEANSTAVSTAEP